MPPHPMPATQFVNWTVNGRPGQHLGQLCFRRPLHPDIGSPISQPITYSVAVSASPLAGGTVSGGGLFFARRDKYRDGHGQWRLQHDLQLDGERLRGKHINELYLRRQYQPRAWSHKFCSPIMYTVTVTAPRRPMAGLVAGGVTYASGSTNTVTGFTQQRLHVRQSGR